MTIRDWQWLSFGVLVALFVVGGVYDYVACRVAGNPATFSGLIRRAFEAAPVTAAGFLLWVGVGVGHCCLGQRVEVGSCPRCPHCHAAGDGGRDNHDEGRHHGDPDRARAGTLG